MVPTEETKRYVISKYVTPARSRGEEKIQIRVGNVQKEMGWTNRTPSVFSTLASRSFQREAGLELIEKRGGPPSGGPSTTVEFLYRMLDTPENRLTPRPSQAPVPNGSGLKALYGALRETFRNLGGGEAFLKAERAAWGAEPWDKIEAERKQRKEKAK